MKKVLSRNITNGLKVWWVKLLLINNHKKEKKMIDTYLLQRAEFRNHDTYKGLDKILLFEYMGSAEFEFGALGKSLERIRQASNTYSYKKYRVKGKTFTVYAVKSVHEYFEEFINKLIDNKIRLKEASYIGRAFEKYKHYNTSFWWSLDNDFMFWVENKDFEQEFKKLILV